MNVVMMILAVCFLAGCKDIPYQEQESTLNLDEATARNAAVVDKVKNEGSKSQPEPSIPDSRGRNVDSPSMRRDVIEIEDGESHNKGGSGRTSGNNVISPPLQPVTVDPPPSPSEDIVPPFMQPVMEEEA